MYLLNYNFHVTRRKRLNITTSDLVVITLLGLHIYLSVSKPITKCDRTQHADMVKRIVTQYCTIN